MSASPRERLPYAILEPIGAGGQVHPNICGLYDFGPDYLRRQLVTRVAHGRARPI